MSAVAVYQADGGSGNRTTSKGINGSTKVIRMEYSTYSILVRNIDRAIKNLKLKRADSELVRKACGTETLDLVTEYWRMVHTADRRYKTFVGVTVILAFIRLRKMIQETDQTLSNSLVPSDQQNSNGGQSSTIGFSAPLTEEQRALSEKLKEKYGDRPNLDLDGSTVNRKNDWLEWAKAQYGFTEENINADGEGDNRTPFGMFTGMDGQPWCASYVSWCLYMAGDTTLTPTASTWAMKEEAVKKGIYRDYTGSTPSDYIPKPGDIFYKCTDEANHYGHVGFISSVEQNADGSITIKTIEGNRGQKCTSRTFSSMEEFKKEFHGVIEMNREEKTTYSDNVYVSSTDDGSNTSTR